MRHPLVTAAIVTALLGASRVAADPAVYIRTTVPAKLCRLDTDYCREVEPGRYLSEELFEKLDGELRRLQAAETRLKAENASLRKATSGWQPGWRTLLVVLGTGLAGGAYLAYGR